jgi:hypothetical protein
MAATAPKTDLKNAFEMLNRMTRMSKIVMSDKTMNGQPISKEFRNANQAEILRGLSQLIRYFRDWETSDYEKTLGTVSAQDLLGTEINLGDMNRPLFPKADLYALSIATAAQFLNSFQSHLSPLFSMDFEGNAKFLDRDESADQKAKDECRPLADVEAYEGALAGIVEIHSGKRDGVVKTAHLARWLIALTEFYNSLDGAEKSSSLDLVTPDKCGVKPIDQITQSRKTILQLIAGVTNFLSHKMVNEQGLFSAEFDLGSKKLSGIDTVSVLDQALAIRALLASSAILGIESYQFAAIDAYYKMNHHLFDKRQRFYKNANDQKALQLPVVLEVLRAMAALEPLLSVESADQLRWIMEPWLAGLEKIKF